MRININGFFQEFNKFTGRQIGRIVKPVTTTAKKAAQVAEKLHNNKVTKTASALISSNLKPDSMTAFEKMQGAWGPVANQLKDVPMVLEMMNAFIGGMQKAFTAITRVNEGKNDNSGAVLNAILAQGEMNRSMMQSNNQGGR